MRQGAHHWVAALARSAGNPRRYSLCVQRHYRQAASDAAIAADELPQNCEQRLAQGLQQPRPSRYAGMRLPRNWCVTHLAEANVQMRNGRSMPFSDDARAHGESPRRRATMHCHKDANYCVMRSAELPNKRILTSTSVPIGHRIAGGLSGFGALASMRVWEKRLPCPAGDA
jgi:hypothetical protein